MRDNRYVKQIDVVGQVEGTRKATGVEWKARTTQHEVVTGGVLEDWMLQLWLRFL
jgi:hypothetical protein